MDAGPRKVHTDNWKHGYVPQTPYITINLMKTAILQQHRNLDVGCGLLWISCVGGVLE